MANGAVCAAKSPGEQSLRQDSAGLTQLVDNNRIGVDQAAVAGPVPDQMELAALVLA